MTRERIEDMREVVLPFVKKRLLETNYEGLGEDDAKEFEREFNEILNLAIKALEQEPTTKNDSSELEKNSKKLTKECEDAYNKGYADGKKEQEPIRPMVEIDLYSVIKQKYIERDVLDKIRAELHATAEMHEDGDYYLRDEWIDEYFDKYKAESEVDNGNDE